MPKFENIIFKRQLVNIVEHANQFQTLIDLEHKINSISSLPPLPKSAQQLIQLKNSDDISLAELAKIIEYDPFLTVQVLRWANSSLYGNLKNITSIEEAIHRVLGLNFVIDILLTLSIMKPLQFQKQGQIGSKMFWLHIFSSIALTKELIKNIDPAIRPNQDEIKALILLHNIGYPLLNDLFTEEFLFLAQAIDSNMNLSIPNIEDLLIGTSHAQIGAWLAENWNLPDLFKTIIYHHHNPNYRGDYYIHNLVIYTNNYLLGKLQIGDGINQLCNDEIYSILNLDDNKCQKYVDSISDELPNFLTLAETML